MTLRLHSAVVLPADPDCSVLRDAVVDIDARADRLLRAAETAPSGPDAPATTRKLSGILLPGLINAHAHSPMVLLRGMVVIFRCCVGCAR